VGITGKPDDPGSTRGKPDRERYTAAADQARLARNAVTRTTAAAKAAARPATVTASKISMASNGSERRVGQRSHQ